MRPLAHRTPITPRAVRPLFAFNGTPAELPSLQNNGAVFPVLMPPGLQSKVVMRGKGGIAFLENYGISFGLPGQQNTDVAFLQFQGKQTGSLFDPGSAGAISFALTSNYSYADRKALLTVPPANHDFRVVFQVYQSLTQIFQLTITTSYGRLSFSYRLAGTDRIYSFPAGQEDALFGKGCTAKVRMVWDGQGNAQLLINDQLADSFTYNALIHWTWNDGSSFSIGATDQHSYSGGFYATDDAVSQFQVWNQGPAAGPNVPKVTLSNLQEGVTVAGVIPLRSTSDNSLAPASYVSYKLDGQDVTGPVYYPYGTYLDTRGFSDGPHRLEAVARSSGGGTAVKRVNIIINNAGGAGSADTTPPQPVTGFATDLLNSGSIGFSWDIAADDRGAVSYDIFRDGQPIATVPEPAPNGPRRVSYQDNGLAPSSLHDYQVQSRDAAGNISPLSAPFELTTKAQDGRVLRVGPGADYATPCAAFRDAKPWDTITIDAAGSDTYAGDVCTIGISNLTIRGINGRPHVDAAGLSAGGKAIWLVTADDTVVENVELSGAIVPDGNGAGIRLEGKDLTLRSVYFHDNENGILVSSIGKGQILIEYSEFAYNGIGDGQTHNLYIGGGDSLIFRYNYSHNALGGQLLKTRAKTNVVTYNRLTDEDGLASYELDISNGGLSYVVGNILQQSPFYENDTFVAYGREGIPAGYLPQLYMVNNTFVNLAPTGRLVVTPSGVNMLFQNNLIAGPGAIPTASDTVTVASNVLAPISIFPQSAVFDYWPVAGSVADGAGTAPPVLDNGVSLAPVFEYRHPNTAIVRPASDHPDAGAMRVRELP